MGALAEVLARPDVWRGDRVASSSLPGLASGFPELDAALPGGGWPRGALVECLVDGAGFGEVSLLMPTLSNIRAEGGWSLAVGAPYLPHAPAWAAAGVDLSRLVVVAPVSERDALWAAEQALQSGVPAAVLCWARHADARAVRRLQVAAAAHRAVAFLFRPASAAAFASAAPLRLALSAGANGGLSVAILKRRGPPLSRALSLDVPRPFAHHGTALVGARSAALAARGACRSVSA